MKVIILNNPISKLVGKFSEIRSVQLPDGRYMIPERLLDDPDLASAVDEINAETDTTSDVELLPDNGTITKDVIYRWTDSDVSADGDPITLVICRQTHQRTIYKPSETPALFTFFRGNNILRMPSRYWI